MTFKLSILDRKKEVNHITTNKICWLNSASDRDFGSNLYMVQSRNACTHFLQWLNDYKLLILIIAIECLGSITFVTIDQLYFDILFQWELLLFL